MTEAAEIRVGAHTEPLKSLLDEMGDFQTGLQKTVSALENKSADRLVDVRELVADRSEKLLEAAESALAETEKLGRALDEGAERLHKVLSGNLDFLLLGCQMQRIVF